MEIYSIFAKERESVLWAVCYPEDGGDLDIFTKLFDQWNDTQFLRDFFLANESHLKEPFWQGISIDDAITQVQTEAQNFESLLYSIETKQPGYEHISITSIFKPLHNNSYSINTSNENQRKGKPIASKPMLRLYGLELEDGTLVITGGGIKLTRAMEGELEIEKRQLKRVENFLKSAGISDKIGLIT